MRARKTYPVVLATIEGNQIDLSQQDLRWLRSLSYLQNGGHFILPSTFDQWVMVYNGATVKIIKPTGRGAQPETRINFL